jgi:tRNA dimethylallyltransferase
MIKIPFIIGPTAIGKTKLSLAIAKIIPVEIVSADSRQIYRYLNIGTAKPSKAELKQVTHHLIDFLRPDEYFSAGMFCRIGRKIIEQILARKKTPLVVGGSGLYVRALVDGLFRLEVRDEKIRNSLRKRILNEGVESLYTELKQLDPALAEKIQSRDKQRIIRGLEVYLVTGQKLSKLQENQATPADFDTIFYGITAERRYLYQRINQRVDEMIDRGLLAEVAALKRMGYTPKLNALNTVGYKEAFDYLETKITYDEMLEAIKRNTRRYSKRQLTWFNRDSGIKWFTVDAHTDYTALAGEIVADYMRKTT